MGNHECHATRCDLQLWKYNVHVKFGPSGERPHYFGILKGLMQRISCLAAATKHKIPLWQQE